MNPPAGRSFFCGLFGLLILILILVAIERIVYCVADILGNIFDILFDVIEQSHGKHLPTVGRDTADGQSSRRSCHAIRMT